MPLFSISDQQLTVIEQANFGLEKALQGLIEKNLKAVFNCRFVASEFPTGAAHAGRIDTLALSEDGNPVIIEYKKVESSELINQSLYYLAWINDHQGDFEIAVQRALGTTVQVDWSAVRVICIAPNYRKYDLYAVQAMGVNIELWTYRLYKKQLLHMEEVLQRSLTPTAPKGGGKKTPTLTGKKTAIDTPPPAYAFDQHLVGKPEKVRTLALAFQEFVLRIDPAIEEAPKKHYVAYRTSQNIVCMEVQANRLLLFVKLNPKEVPNAPRNSRDVSSIGHFGTGDFELSVKTPEDLEIAKPYVQLAYNKIGG